MAGENALSQGAQISIIDVIGRRVQPIQNVGGLKKIDINIQGNAAGVYLIRLHNNQKIYIFKYVLK